MTKNKKLLFLELCASFHLYRMWASVECGDFEEAMTEQFLYLDAYHEQRAVIFSLSASEFHSYADLANVAVHGS
jgi:hypothetical protein